MAPRFKQCMYNTYSTKRGVSAMICFPFSEAKLRFPFRDRLAEAITEAPYLEMHRSQGTYEVDSWLRFFSEQNSQDVSSFFARKPPGFLSRLLNLSSWRDYCKERERVGRMTCFELTTSHDNTCIEVNSTIHNEHSLSELIQAVAGKMGIEMPLNDKLPPIGALFFSNKSFDL